MDNTIALTIDCEEWNSPALRGKNDGDHNNTQFSREGNDTLLALFRKHNIKATFFITGYYAHHEPENVKRIAAEGHEIACHGYEHRYRGREFDIEHDVRKAKRALEHISGSKVLGFRAPQVAYSRDLLRALAKAGYIYDSSLHPAWMPGYYNNRQFPLHIHKTTSGIVEIPIGVMPNSRLPIVWMFMRLLGWRWTQAGVNGLLRRGLPATLYIHSWEFIRMKSRNVPFYFTWNTGKPFTRTLEKFIVHNKGKGRNFMRLDDIGSKNKNIYQRN